MVYSPQLPKQRRNFHNTSKVPGNGPWCTRPGGGRAWGHGAQGPVGRRQVLRSLRGAARIIDVRVLHSHCFMFSREEERPSWEVWIDITIGPSMWTQIRVKSGSPSRFDSTSSSTSRKRDDVGHDTNDANFILKILKVTPRITPAGRAAAA